MDARDTDTSPLVEDGEVTCIVKCSPGGALSARRARDAVRSWRRHFVVARARGTWSGTSGRRIDRIRGSARAGARAFLVVVLCTFDAFVIV